MRDYYQVFNIIFKEELAQGKKIVLYGLGPVGLQAKAILENRFGQDALLIDNEMCEFNLAVKDKSVIQELNDKYVVVVCIENPSINHQIVQEIKNDNATLTIRNCLEPPVKMIQGSEELIYAIKDLCRVKKCTDYPLVRIGKTTDGGYVMLDDFKKSDIAYSFGIGEDISWDEDSCERCGKVYCFDHTIEGLPHPNNKLTYVGYGIAGEDCEEEKVLSISTILKNNGDLGNRNLILKMDVEGAEWEFLKETSIEVLAQFKQITFELHNLSDLSRYDIYVECINKLRKNHTPVWVHANNGQGIIKSGETVIPALLEITFVRNDTYKLVDTTYSIPQMYDAPNVKRFLEVSLDNWGTLDE